MTHMQNNDLTIAPDPDGNQYGAASEASELAPPRSGGAETAFDRIAAGEVCAVTRLALDPARVRVWPGNARVYDRLSQSNCGDLIASIIAEGGQKVPAVLRRIADDPAHDYRVIAGTRRHFAISWLRANGYPAMRFVGLVQALDDEAAFRLADIANRARKDVSDIERARNSETGAAQAIAETAATIATEQAARRSAGLEAIAAPKVIRRLKSVGLPPRQQFQPFEAESRYGLAMLSVTASDRQGITLRLHHSSGAHREEVLQALQDAMDWLQSQGKGRWD